MDGKPPAKRRKLSDGTVDAAELRTRRAAFLDSLSRPVSPPPGQGSKSNLRAKNSKSQSYGVVDSSFKTQNASQETKTDVSGTQETSTDQSIEQSGASSLQTRSMSIPSPFQLTRIKDLPASENVDSISLHDILGDPLIKEAWIFNFCFDVDWLMQYFDPDVRDIVQVKIVHGSWRKEDINKLGIDDACSRRANVRAIQAYLPDAFGTHHSKMFVLFRHDDMAQVIIHTANMLSKDWTNMTQAVWRSPLLPLQQNKSDEHPQDANHGTRFKHDLRRYFGAYGNKLKSLVQQLQLYNFGEVKAALVASVPSKFEISAADDKVWGYEMLRRKLQCVADEGFTAKMKSHFVFQISSIASLPTNWLEETLYSACGTSKQSTSIIFPTAPDVAKSLDGYMAGGSIHMKAQSNIHLKQIALLRPQLCRWAQGQSPVAEAGRHLAAPHIKTYTCFASKPSAKEPLPNIHWVLVTSANLSTQAWGTTPKLAKGEKNPRDAVIHIQSFEIGVLVWPGVFDSDRGESGTPQEVVSRMVPVFKKDTPVMSGTASDCVIGFRMPYDLPLTSYSAQEMPWSPQSSYDSPDSHGRLWQ